MHIIQSQACGEIMDLLESGLSNVDLTNPINKIKQTINHIHLWLKQNVKTTMFLSIHWTRPIQSYLYKDKGE